MAEDLSLIQTDCDLCRTKILGGEYLKNKGLCNYCRNLKDGKFASECRPCPNCGQKTIPISMLETHGFLNPGYCYHCQQDVYVPAVVSSALLTLFEFLLASAFLLALIANNLFFWFVFILLIAGCILGIIVKEKEATYFPIFKAGTPKKYED